MTRKYFGTDGIRGRVGEGVISADFVLRLGNAYGHALRAAVRHIDQKHGGEWRKPRIRTGSLIITESPLARDDGMRAFSPSTRSPFHGVLQ